MRLHQKLLGTPFVYDKVRPWVLGGIDLGPLYADAELRPDDVVLDIGCGTGNALDYIRTFDRYAGFDLDPVAIEAAKRRTLGRSNVSFTCDRCSARDIEAIAPSVVILAGLLHHLSDAEAKQLLALTVSAPTVRRVLTLDIVYLSGFEYLLSNVFAALDRGRHCRRPEGYRELVRNTGLSLVRDSLIWNNPQRRRACYFTMRLEPVHN